jgi:hypothetical protein
MVTKRFYYDSIRAVCNLFGAAWASHHLLLPTFNQQPESLDDPERDPRSNSTTILSYYIVVKRDAVRTCEHIKHP